MAAGARFRSSAATPSAAVARSFRRAAVVRAPSCPAVTSSSRGCPAGATRTPSRRCRVPRWTPRAGTRSRMSPVPRPCRGTTTGRVPARRRRCPRFDERQNNGAPAYGSNAPQNTGQYGRPGADDAQNTGQYAPAGQPRAVLQPGTNNGQNNGQYSQPATNDAQNTASSSAVTSSGLRRADRTRQRRASSPHRRGTTTAPPASTRPRARTTAPPASSSVRRPTARTAPVPSRRGSPVPPVPSAPPQQRPDGRGASDAWALPPAPAPATAVRRCTTPWRPTGSTVQRRAGAAATARLRHPSSRNSSPSAPQQPQRGHRPAATASAAWRTSPNDELVRQAERVRKPAAGGITTSGLPRRVPAREPRARARLSSRATRPVRRSRVRPMTCAAG